MSSAFSKSASIKSSSNLSDLKSDLLLSPKQMKLAIIKERLRCDRSNQTFGLIITQLFCSKSEFKTKQKKFAQILDQRLRITDERGLIEDSNIAILLPATDYKGTRHVLSSITSLAADEGIFFRAKVVVYPALDIATSDMVTSPENKDDSNDEYTGSNVYTILDKVISGDSDLGFPQIPVSCQAIAVGNVYDYVARPYPKWKRAFDITAALAGLIATAPLMGAAAAAIRLTSDGPVFFSQARTGQFGKKFHILKLRTMVKNAEEMKSSLQEMNERDGPAFKMKSDPRVTKVGSMLRRTGLDELPQLINVLKGEMAIVGPRPLPCDEDADCEAWQRRRLDTKPGLTCYWQISKSRKIPFVDWMRMDLRYADKRSLPRDLMLVLKTFASVFLGRVGH